MSEINWKKEGKVKILEEEREREGNEVGRM